MDKEVQKELLNKTGDFINQAAQTLGATAQHVYEVLVKQQFVEGIGGLVVVAVAGLGTWLVSRSFWTWAWAKKKKDRYSDAWQLIWLVVPLALLAFVCVGLGIALSIQKLINPEYYAIKFIFEAVK